MVASLTFTCWAATAGGYGKSSQGNIRGKGVFKHVEELQVGVACVLDIEVVLT
jgi:hypothetical protein